MNKLKYALAVAGTSVIGGMTALAEGASTLPGTKVNLAGDADAIATAIEGGLAPYAAGALTLIGAIMGFAVLLLGIVWLWRVGSKFFRGSKG